MSNNYAFLAWTISAERNWLGDTYVLLYKDAPDWVRHQVLREFGTETVLLWSTRTRPLTEDAAA